jgi:hypothetical protein
MQHLFPSFFQHFFPSFFQKKITNFFSHTQEVYAIFYDIFFLSSRFSCFLLLFFSFSLTQVVYVIFTVFTLIMAVVQAHQILRNVTTNELINYHR